MPVHMHVFHNFQDAVNWLGLGDHMEEVKQFWQEFKRENMAE